MPALHEIIALKNGKTSQVESNLKNLYHQSQKSGAFEGMTRTYAPVNDGEEELPPETKKVQIKAKEVLEKASSILKDFFDLTITQDAANQLAKADIVVDGQVLAQDVPVSTLLFLEKHVVDIRTVINHIPVLDGTCDWKYDSAKGLYKSDSQVKNRTAKKQKPIVLYDATDKHPAQTELITEDVKIGEFTTIKTSGALSSDEKEEYLKKVEKLISAIKVAREKANAIKVENVAIAENLFSYVFGK